MSNKVLESIKGGLVVSCQALAGNPLKKPEYMAVLAQAAELGGAVAIRANGTEDIAAIKEKVTVPIIGINKTAATLEYPYITPSFQHAEDIAKLGVEIIALDATRRTRPDGTDLDELIKRIKEELGVLVMADIATFEEGVLAAKAGADIVATTLSGYTTYSKPTVGPDLELIKKLKEAVDVPIIAEGRFTSPEHVRAGIDAGAHAVVIGKAITNIMFNTGRFIKEAGLKKED